MVVLIYIYFSYTDLAFVCYYSIGYILKWPLNKGQHASQIFLRPGRNVKGDK